MGNRGLLRAMQRIGSKVGGVENIRFGQIILAAPDVDPGLFRELAVMYPQVAARTTMYVSPHDRAVSWSRWVHDGPRVGLTPPVTVVKGIDTIEVPCFDLTHARWHSYFAEEAGPLHDVFDLIRRNSAPSDRQRLREAQTEDGATYWILE